MEIKTELMCAPTRLSELVAAEGIIEENLLLAVTTDFIELEDIQLFDLFPTRLIREPVGLLDGPEHFILNRLFQETEPLEQQTVEFAHIFDEETLRPYSQPRIVARAEGRVICVLLPGASVAGVWNYPGVVVRGRGAVVLKELRALPAKFLRVTAGEGCLNKITASTNCLVIPW